MRARTPPDPDAVPARLAYHLRDPRTRRPRYGGQTKSPLAVRLAEHLAVARAGSPAPVSVWVRGLLADGLEPEIVATGYTSEQGAIDAIAPGDRLNVRRAGSGRRGRELSPVEFALLGRVPDRYAGEALGVSEETVERRRRRHGVPAAFGMGRPSRADLPVIEARLREHFAERAAELAADPPPPPIEGVLGTAPDREIGARYGYSAVHVLRLRQKHGVPSWRSQRAGGGPSTAPDGGPRP